MTPVNRANSAMNAHSRHNSNNLSQKSRVQYFDALRDGQQKQTNDEKYRQLKSMLLTYNNQVKYPKTPLPEGSNLADLGSEGQVQHN
jgi:hypothetical protein